MQGRELRAEMVIKINYQEDLDKLSNIKMDIQLLESPRKERHKEIKPESMAVIKPETNPLVPEPGKVVILVSSIKAKATVKPIKR